MIQIQIIGLSTDVSLIIVLALPQAPLANPEYLESVSKSNLMIEMNSDFINCMFAEIFQHHVYDSHQWRECIAIVFRNHRLSGFGAIHGITTKK